MNRLALAIAIYFALTITCIAEIPTTDSLTDQRAFLEQISLNETPTKGEGDLSDLSEPKGEKYESAYPVNNDNPPLLLTEQNQVSTLAFGDSYSLAPLIGYDTDSFYWASDLLASSTHVFDGTNEWGGGNNFGTTDGRFLILEGVFPQGGGIDRYVVEVRAVNSSFDAEPWVDNSWAGNNLNKWRLDVGTSTGGGNPLSPGFTFSVIDSGFFAFDSSEAFLGDFDLYIDSSSSTSLSGSAWLNNGGSEIAGVDVAIIQLYWDILPTPADLDLQIVDATNGTYSPGDSVDVHNVTKNIGSTVSNAYKITFYASTNSIISEADVPLGFVNRPALDPNATHNYVTSPTLPSSLPWGSYYIGAILTVADANSANNINVDLTPITVTTPADLSLQVVDAEDGAYTPGSALNVFILFENVGGSASVSSPFAVYASSDTTITTSDRLIGSFVVSSLEPGALGGGNAGTTLPLDLVNGDYYIGAIVNISDADPNNNVNHDPNPITVSTDPEISIRPLSLDFTEEVQPILANSVVFENGITPYEMTQTVLPNLMAKAEKDGKVQVIVGFDAPFRPEGFLNASEKQSQRRGIQNRGSQLIGTLRGFNFQENRRFRFIPFAALTVDANTLEHLARLPMVTSIEENSRLSPTLASSNDVIGSPLAWAEGYDGSGQTIAILDTGVDKTHSWFTTDGSKVVSEACYSTTGDGATSVCPDGVPSSTDPGSGVDCGFKCEHGTHVAGISTGNDGVGPNFGVARGADIIAIQVFSRNDDQTVSAQWDDIEAALERVYELRDTFDIAAVNMSLGGGQFFDQATCDAARPSIKAAIDNLRSVKIATVISSGNEGWKDSISAPGCISSAISVGNSTDFDAVAGGSNIYPQIHLVAPGTSITSSVPGGGTDVKDGTSMAAPHVAGAWAVLKQIYPDATVDDVLNILQNTGTLVDDLRPGGIETDMPRINVDLAIGEPRTTFGIFNEGPGVLTVSSITTETSAPWISWMPEAPFDIQSGELKVLSVSIDFASAPEGDSQTRLLINSNDSNESPYPGGVFVNVNALAKPAPEFDSTPAAGTTVAFGEQVENTESGALDVQVDNLGDADLTLGCSITGSDSSSFNLKACPTPIIGAGSGNILVSCQPQSLGTKSAVLEVTTNDTDEANVTYSLTCTGTPTPTPEFDSTPAPSATLAFGDQVEQTESADLMVQVDNLGNADLTLGCSITGTDSGSFNLKACPTPIAGAGSGNITVSCEPVSVGAKTATLEVVTNDADEPNVSYNLICTGIEKPPADIIFSDGFED